MMRIQEYKYLNDGAVLKMQKQIFWLCVTHENLVPII
jgi:hypothetical protein